MFIKLFLITLPVFFLLDFIWLRLLMRNFYFAEFSPIARRTSRALRLYFPTALIGYLIVLAGFVHFVLEPNFGKPLTSEVIFEGAFFAFVVNAFFEFLGHALIDKWPAKMLIIDNLWALILGGLTTFIVLTVANKFL